MKLMYAMGFLALTFTMGCNNQPADEPVQVIEKETVKVERVETPAPAPAPAEPVKVKVEEEKGTTIKIGPDGGSVKTKKVDVSINN